ncbi:MAG: diguanylate cyclase [Pseudomonadota bacterium]
MSLRLKFILALLFTSLAAVALVGVIAYARIYNKVDTMRRQQAANHFHQSVTEYLGKYGDWRTAMASEPFDQFMQRSRRRPGPDAGPGSGAPARGGEGLAHAATLIAPLPPGPDRARGRPERGDGDDGGDGRDAGGRPLPRPPRAGEGAGGPPRPAGGQPPFHFILTDADFKVLLGAGEYEHGEPLPAAARQDAQAVVVNGRTLAYVSPQGVLTPSKQELEFLASVRDALLIGGSCAVLLALGLGLLLASGLSRSLSGLTLAVRAMQGGSLLQRVPVQGRDEVATLASAFNQMSEELAKSHAELNATHQTIMQQSEQLKELSIRDALTGLYNRRHFDEQAGSLYHQAIRHGRPLSMVIADIDHFKRINDQFSHATGDAVLRQVSAILRHHVRQSDLVARYGGEEFVIALPETSLPQAAALCNKLRDLIEGFPWHEIHVGLKVTMSMGVYADLAADNAEAMLQKADALLYQAKESGRNRVCFA